MPLLLTVCPSLFLTFRPCRCCCLSISDVVLDHGLAILVVTMHRLLLYTITISFRLFRAPCMSVVLISACGLIVHVQVQLCFCGAFTRTHQVTCTCPHCMHAAWSYARVPPWLALRLRIELGRQDLYSSRTPRDDFWAGIRLPVGYVRASLKVQDSCKHHLCFRYTASQPTFF